MSSDTLGTYAQRWHDADIVTMTRSIGSMTSTVYGAHTDLAPIRHTLTAWLRHEGAMSRLLGRAKLTTQEDPS